MGAIVQELVHQDEGENGLAIQFSDKLIVEQACEMLAKCVRIDEAKGISDKAAAISVWMRKQQASIEAQQNAAEISIRAQRRLGELLAQLPKAQGRRADLTSRIECGKSKEEILESNDLTTEDCSRAERLARVEENEFESRIEASKTEGILSINKILKSLQGIATSISAHAEYDSDEWYTPSEYVEVARDLMGEIDLDPASCNYAQEIVRAKTFFTKEDEALAKKWAGRIWLNPPYSQPLMQMFAEHLLKYFDSGDVSEAILLVNSYTDNRWCQTYLQRFPACFTAGRISFEQTDGRKANNRNGQIFFYLGEHRERFAKLFRRFGAVIQPMDIVQ